MVLERRKFGAQGWNRIYPFNAGDLRICLDVLYNYLEASSKVPWEDLRYLFGEIMYGGHITDDWDRRLCRTFLEEYLQPELVSSMSTHNLLPTVTGINKFLLCLCLLLRLTVTSTWRPTSWLLQIPTTQAIMPTLMKHFPQNHLTSTVSIPTPRSNSSPRMLSESFVWCWSYNQETLRQPPLILSLGRR